MVPWARCGSAPVVLQQRTRPASSCKCCGPSLCSGCTETSRAEEGKDDWWRERFWDLEGLAAEKIQTVTLQVGSECRIWPAGRPVEMKHEQHRVSWRFCKCRMSPGFLAILKCCVFDWVVTAVGAVEPEGGLSVGRIAVRFFLYYKTSNK